MNLWPIDRVYQEFKKEKKDEVFLKKDVHKCRNVRSKYELGVEKLLAIQELHWKDLWTAGRI